MTFTLAVCSEMVYLDQPHLDRVKRIHDAGFAVEIWDWTTKDAAALAATGARFTSMTGYVSGDLTSPAGAGDLLAYGGRVDRVRRRIGAPALNLHGTGLGRAASRSARGGRDGARCGWPRCGPSSGSRSSVNSTS